MCITLLYYSPSSPPPTPKKRKYHFHEFITRKQTKFFCFVKRKNPPSPKKKILFDIQSWLLHVALSYLKKIVISWKRRIMENPIERVPKMSLERPPSPENVTSCSHNDHSRHTWLHLIVSEVARRGARCDACHGTGNKVIHGQKPDLCIAAVTMQIDDTRRWFSC